MTHSRRKDGVQLISILIHIKPPSGSSGSSTPGTNMGTDAVAQKQQLATSQVKRTQRVGVWQSKEKNSANFIIYSRIDRQVIHYVCSKVMFFIIMALCHETLGVTCCEVTVILVSKKRDRKWKSMEWRYALDWMDVHQEVLINPHAPGEGEISLPHSRAIFSKLEN